MRVGKTSEEEIKTVFDFLNELSWLSKEIRTKRLEDIELQEDYEILSKFNQNDHENFIEDICNHADNLFYERVLTNCSVLLDNAADPNLSHLDWKPELKQLFEPKGFKDKNGKQFGDGDVLQFTEHPEYLLKTGKMLVCWDEEYGAYGYKWENDRVKCIHVFSEHDELNKDVLNHCELIGDIEKHPELLLLFQ